ncbi:cobalamin binding intrinsic factor-like [Pecten maximus]|uniref:cobalamin binding intrinsic factor-like n=1 Tax=Pecten maximus TaxID=6579 RepID=UPI001458FD81|nr:cobalamin binding intrinsic factor-like [Pecten maximus]
MDEPTHIEKGNKMAPPDKEVERTHKMRDICLTITIVAVAIAISIAMIVYLAGKPHTTRKEMNLIPTIKKAIMESVQVSLSTTPGWSHYRLDTAEAIIGVTLAYPEAYDEHRSAYLAKLANMNIDIQAALINDSELTSTVWSRGKLAQYISGILVSGQHETAHSYYGTTNLLDILQNHLVRSIDYFRINRFALSWMALAMCQHNKTFDRQYEDILTAHPGTYTFGIDEAAMITMACTCLNTTTSLPAAHVAADIIAMEIQKENNTLNEYSLGLAAQALISIKNESYEDQIAKAKMGIVSKIKISDIMKDGLAASHILPALADMSYIDIGINPPIPRVTDTTTDMVMLEIVITMDDPILTNTTKRWDANVSVTKQPTLLQAMHALQAQASSGFSFETTPTSFGPMVITIDGITRNETNMYWRILLAPDTPLSKGVVGTNPQNGEHYIFRLTTFGPH